MFPITIVNLVYFAGGGFLAGVGLGLIWRRSDRLKSQEIERLRPLVGRDRKSAGLCGCNCGQEIFWSGVGKKPKFLNQLHKEVAYGQRNQDHVLAAEAEAAAHD
jgi:hypothetical protein